MPELHATSSKHMLFCSQYRREELILKSDNLSSLAILREFITREATMQKIRIQLSFKLVQDSIRHSISILWPQIRRHMEHSRESLLLEALQVRKTIPVVALVQLSPRALGFSI